MFFEWFTKNSSFKVYAPSEGYFHIKKNTGKEITKTVELKMSYF